MPYAYNYFDTGAPLIDLTVEITGNETFTLGFEDYREVKTDTGYRYETVQNVADAQYTFEVMSVTDIWGKSTNPNISETYYGAIPDGTVSRTNDDSSFGYSDSRGVTINSTSEYGAIAARISSMTSGATRARLYDYNQSTYIETVDVSGLSAGDAFAFDSDIKTDRDYGIELDDNGNEVTFGFPSGVSGYPYSDPSVDIEIIANSIDGSANASASPTGVTDIGNPDSILG